MNYIQLDDSFNVFFLLLLFWFFISASAENTYINKTCTIPSGWDILRLIACLLSLSYILSVCSLNLRTLVPQVLVHLISSSLRHPLCTYPQRAWNLALPMYVDCSMQEITKTVTTLIFRAICTMPETTICLSSNFFCLWDQSPWPRFLCNSLLLWSSHEPGRLLLINYCTWNTVPQTLHSPWLLWWAWQ